MIFKAQRKTKFMHLWRNLWWARVYCNVSKKFYTTWYCNQKWKEDNKNENEKVETSYEKVEIRNE